MRSIRLACAAFLGVFRRDQVRSLLRWSNSSALFSVYLEPVVEQAVEQTLEQVDQIVEQVERVLEQVEQVVVQIEQVAPPFGPLSLVERFALLI